MQEFVLSERSILYGTVCTNQWGPNEVAHSVGTRSTLCTSGSEILWRWGAENPSSKTMIGMPNAVQYGEYIHESCAVHDRLGSRNCTKVPGRPSEMSSALRMCSSHRVPWHDSHGSCERQTRRCKTMTRNVCSASPVDLFHIHRRIITSSVLPCRLAFATLATNDRF